MPVVPLRPRQAQPSLDNYLHGRDGGGDSDLVEPITEDSRSDLPLRNRPSTATNVAEQPRQLTKHLSREERSAHDQVNGRSNGRPGLARAKSDFGPRRESQAENSEEEKSSASEGEFKIRHGWESQLTSEEYNNLLNSTFFMYYTDKRHETGGYPKSDHDQYPLTDWRMKDRLKTVSAVLALCLNIGVDPPDVIKTNPCAKLECWVDPTASSGQSGSTTPMNQIGKNLQTQYEQLSMRTRYKLCLDPTVDETKKYCSTLRKNARNERVLFHYNGHGVPRPTSSGEIWVFNRNYTQYIPISLYDLQSWLGAPSLFVYDCSDAGLIIENFNRFAAKHEDDNAQLLQRDPQAELMDFGDCIHLAACRAKETLPTNPDLPADLFTCCLTTPIEIAVHFFILQNPLPSKITIDDVRSIPGRVSERRTPIGELNWIFTAITDTIAWNSLPRSLFKKLFRQDLMVAALFRNYLLAQRIMRVYHCHPVSHPEVPSTHDNPLWKSWDLAVEMILSQLPDLQAAQEGKKQYEYQHSQFFTEQLTAFEVYLGQGAAERKSPEQLPIVLQVLLSQVHRLRALILLSKFLDLGPWAVNLALSIGIFPYVLKLLQSQAMELKPVMIFIWARILAVDQSCQTDLLKDNGYQYFISILNPAQGIPAGNILEHRAMCAFIVAMFCKDFRQGQVVSLSRELIDSCVMHLGEPHALLRQWACLCLSMLWIGYPEAKWAGIRCNAHMKLCELVLDPAPEVRAAMLYALTAFLGIPDLTPQVAQIEESLASMVLVMTADGSNMVRKELLVFFSTFIARHMNKIVVTAYEQLEDERSNHLRMSNSNGALSKPQSTDSDEEDSEDSHFSSHNTVFYAMWQQVLVMSVDPHPDVAHSASIIVDCVLEELLNSPLGKYARPCLDELTRQAATGHAQPETPAPQQPTSKPSMTPSASMSEKMDDSYFSVGLKRTASFAASIKNLAFGPVSTPDTSPSNSMRGPPRLTPNDRSRSRLPSDWVSEAQTPANAQQPAKLPMPRGMKNTNVRGEEPAVPLRSHFYEWSVEYFREPQMKSSEADEPGSEDYNARLWRRNRNDAIIAETQPQKEVAGSHAWDKPKAYFSNGSQPMKMCFHQFENHLVVTDNSDGVCVWDWHTQARLSRFSNGNPRGSRITEVRLINEDDQALLMTGSSDGVIKLFRNYEATKRVELVTSFRALTDLVQSNKHAGLVFDWQQGRGSVLVAGDVKVIRVWNAGTEICTSDIPARSGSCITSLTSDQVEGDVFVAGFGDGAVRVYDQRERPQTAMVRVFKEHRKWVTNVHLQRGGQRELVSGCTNGEIKLWDIRMDKSVKTIRATKDIMRTLSVHEHAPVFATGTDRRHIKVFNLNSGLMLNSFEPNSGFMQQHRAAAIAGTAFHPHRMLLAAASINDNHVNIYSCLQSKNEVGFEGGHSRPEYGH